MAKSSHSLLAPKKLAATEARNFRTFLLMEQFAAREIGLRIALARRERGLTQEQLSDLANISERSLQDYEAGVTVPYKHMPVVARLLGRPVEWFLHGDGEEVPVTTDQLAQLHEEVATLRGMLEELLRRAS